MPEKSRPLPHPWPPEETFWDRLQRLRNAMGMENAEVAEAAGVHIGTVSNWRQGRTPETGAVLRLAQFFKVTVEWLLTGKPPTEEERRHFQQSVTPEKPLRKSGRKSRRASGE